MIEFSEKALDDALKSAGNRSKRDRIEDLERLVRRCDDLIAEIGKAMDGGEG